LVSHLKGLNCSVRNKFQQYLTYFYILLINNKFFVNFNREAARECRRKKKEYIKCLENRVCVLEKQNKTLIEELRSLRESYCKNGDQ
jgi:hypothetical protein